MQTIKIDILNEHALSLLRNLEQLNLIRVRQDLVEDNQPATDWQKYKGAMGKQSLTEIDQQFRSLRDDWE